MCVCFPPLFSVTHKRLFLSPVPSCAHTDTPKPLLFLQVTSRGGRGSDRERAPRAPRRGPPAEPRPRSPGTGRVRVPKSCFETIDQRCRPGPVAAQCGPSRARCCGVGAAPPLLQRHLPGFPGGTFRGPERSAPRAGADAVLAGKARCGAVRGSAGPEPPIKPSRGRPGGRRPHRHPRRNDGHGSGYRHSLAAASPAHSGGP